MNNPENMEIDNEHTVKKSSENIPSTARDNEDSAAFPSSSPKKNILDGWTKDEKFKLYMGVKASKNVEALQHLIPTKTLHEIERVIHQYTELAQEKYKNKKELTTKKVKTKPSAPNSNLLTDNFSYNELQTETANAFRLLADLDDIPPAELTENIDFRKVYHQIADIMEGKEPTDDPVIAQVLHSCLSDAAIRSKHFMDEATLKQVLSTLKMKENSSKLPQEPTKDVVQGDPNLKYSHTYYNETHTLRAGTRKLEVTLPRKSGEMISFICIRVPSLPHVTRAAFASISSTVTVTSVTAVERDASVHVIAKKHGY